MKKLLFLSIFILINVVNFKYFYTLRLEHKQETIDTHTASLSNLYESAITTFRLNAHSVFENIIMQEDVLNILRKIPHSDDEYKNALRKKLYTLLNERYKNMKKSIHVRQLHFHQTDGRSLLRMHRPDKYGDPLFDARYSVKVVNTQKTYVEGFEEGKIFNGYRYIYPIIDNANHLGSVEISVSMEAIIQQISQIFKDKTFYFMIDKKIISQKLFNSEKANYIDSKLHPKYLVDKEVNKVFDTNFEKYLVKLNTPEMNQKVNSHMLLSQPVIVNSNPVVATFLPIENVEKKFIAYLVSFESNNHFASIRNEFLFQLLLSLLASFVVLSTLYYILEKSNRILALKNKLDELVTLRTDELQLMQDEKIKSYQDIILAMVSLTEERDTYTAGHTQRVAQYAQMIAEEMQYSKEDIQRLHEAAIMHDIGKIITPDSILLKPGQFDSREYSIIQEHVRTGENILNNIALYKNLVDIVRYHHERYDGSGYPYKLKGDEIPPLARILAVADTFDAMTTNRIYKPRKSLEVALGELKSLSGIHYEPEVIEAALKVFDTLTLDESINQLPTNALEEERLSHFFKDPLTGLYNLKYLKLVLDYGINDNHHTCANIISIANFTKFNNQFGWEAGDTVLIQLANILKVKCPKGIVFRIYGDDFVLLHEREVEVKIINIEKMLREECKREIDLRLSSFDLKNKEKRDLLIPTLEKSIG